MELKDVLVAIGVAFWAGAAAVIQGFKVVNDRRDVILTGRFEKEQMTMDHRRVSFWNDWVPLKVGIGLCSLAYAFLAFTIPAWVTPEHRDTVRLLAYGVGVLGILSAAGFIGLGYRDYRYICSVLYPKEDDAGVCDDSHSDAAGADDDEVSLALSDKKDQATTDTARIEPEDRPSPRTPDCSEVV